MHHLLDKNKRVQAKGSSSQNLIPLGKKQIGSNGASPVTLLKQRKQYQGGTGYGSGADKMGAASDKRHIMETVAALEKDLQIRLDRHGKESLSVIECLQHYVKTCNENALGLISLGDPRLAAELLMRCEQLLLSGSVQNYPVFKFQTYNNLAHANNVQGNVRISLKYLLKALESASSVSPEQRQHNFAKGEAPMPIVETYMNICNAYIFLGQLDMALEYSDNAVTISQGQLNDLMVTLDQQQVQVETGTQAQLSAEQQASQDQLYHQYVNLHAMCFQLKGTILEKLKMFEEAILEFREGKQVIEANYGSQHKSYLEFANLINGAKLRTKYFAHSNLPMGEGNIGGALEMGNNSRAGEDQYSRYLMRQKQRLLNEMSNQESGLGSFRREGGDESQQYPPQTVANNLFLREQEMMKPISQQKHKKRTLIRPASAKHRSNVQRNQNLEGLNSGGISGLGGGGHSQIHLHNQSSQDVSEGYRQQLNVIGSQDFQNIRVKPPLINNAARADKLRKLVAASQKGSIGGSGSQKSKKPKLSGGVSAAIYLGSPIGSARSGGLNDSKKLIKRTRPQSAKKAIQIARSSHLVFGAGGHYENQQMPNSILALQNQYNPQQRAQIGISQQELEQQKFQYQQQLNQHQQIHQAHSSQHSEPAQCQDCQSNMEEIRKLQLEQQKMMTMMLQQQLAAQQQTQLKQQQSFQQQTTLQPASNDQHRSSHSSLSPSKSHHDHQSSIHQQQQPPPFMPPPYMYPPYPHPPYYMPPYPMHPGIPGGFYPPPFPPQLQQMPQHNSTSNLQVHNQHSAHSNSSSPERPGSMMSSGFGMAPQQFGGNPWFSPPGPPFSNYYPYPPPPHNLPLDDVQAQQIRTQFGQQVPGTQCPFNPVGYPYPHPGFDPNHSRQYQLGGDLSHMQSTFTNINNERDNYSNFGDQLSSRQPYHLNQNQDSISPDKLHQYKPRQQTGLIEQNSKVDHTKQDGKNQSGNIELIQNLRDHQNDKENRGGQNQIQKIQQYKAQSEKEQQEAAVTLQRFFRKKQHQKQFRILVRQTKQREVFNRQFYNYVLPVEGNKKQGKMTVVKYQLIASLIRKLKRTQNEKHVKSVENIVAQPHSISFQLYDIKKKAIIVELDYKIQAFGFDPTTVIPQHLQNKIKSALSNLHNKTGDPKVDIEELISKIRLKSSSKGSKDKVPKNQKIRFNDENAKSPVKSQTPVKPVQVKVKETIPHVEPEQTQVNITNDFNDDEIQDEYPIDNGEDEEGFKEESIKDEYEDEFEVNIENQSDIQNQSKLEHNQSIKDKSNEKIKIQDLTKQQAQISKDDEERAITKIQARARTFLAQKQHGADEDGDEILMTFFIKPDNGNFVRITVKEMSQKHQKELKNQYRLIVINLKNKKGNDTHKLLLKELPTDLGNFKNNINEYLKITWNDKQDKITKIELINGNKDSKSFYENQIKIQKAHKNEKLDQVKEQELIKEQEAQKQKTLEEQKVQNEAKLKKEAEELKMKQEQEALDEKQKLQKQQEDLKKAKLQQENEEKEKAKAKQESLNKEKEEKAKQEDKKQKEAQKSDEPTEQEIAALTKVQAIVRGKQARNQIDVSNKDAYKTLHKMARKLSNKKLYCIFLMCKMFKEQVKSTEEIFYLVTLRELGAINEIYDLEISFDKAKKIFGRKNASKDEIQQLVNFDTNKQQFINMLSSLDINDEGKFQLDQEKFKFLTKKGANDNSGIVFEVNDVKETKQKKPKDAPKEEKKKKAAYFPRDVIEEVADPSSEATPMKKPNTSAKDDTLEKSGKKQGTVSSFKMNPAQVKQNQQSNKSGMTPFVAVLLIQRSVKRYFARKSYKMLNSNNFLVDKATQDNCKLEIYKKGVVRLANGHIYLIYFLFINKDKGSQGEDKKIEEVKLTIRDTMSKETIVSLKPLKLSDFAGEEEETDIGDLPAFIEDTLKDNADEILIDPSTKMLHKDWLPILKTFVKENI